MEAMSSSDPKITQPSLLLKLPLEIRSLIWKEAIGSIPVPKPDPILPHPSLSAVGAPDDRLPHRGTTILRPGVAAQLQKVCRTIYKDTLPIIYQTEGKLGFEDFEYASLCFKNISPRAGNMIRSLCLTVPSILTRRDGYVKQLPDLPNLLDLEIHNDPEVYFFYPPDYPLPWHLVQNGHLNISLLPGFGIFDPVKHPAAGLRGVTNVTIHSSCFMTHNDPKQVSPLCICLVCLFYDHCILFNECLRKIVMQPKGTPLSEISLPTSPASLWMITTVQAVERTLYPHLMVGFVWVDESEDPPSEGDEQSGGRVAGGREQVLKGQALYEIISYYSLGSQLAVPQALRI